MPPTRSAVDVCRSRFCHSSRALGVSVEALIGEKTPPAKRGPTPKLQQQVERLSRLPQAIQRAVMEMLERFLNQAARTG
jgi:hypothetical protein